MTEDRFETYTNFPIALPYKFAYAKRGNNSSINEYEMLSFAYMAITETDNWDYIRKPNDSFTYSNDQNVVDIYKKIEELGYHGFSGTSFGVAMRYMQYLALNGEEEFRKSYIR